SPRLVNCVLVCSCGRGGSFCPPNFSSAFGAGLVGSWMNPTLSPTLGPAGGGGGGGGATGAASGTGSSWGSGSAMAVAPAGGGGGSEGTSSVSPGGGSASSTAVAVPIIGSSFCRASTSAGAGAETTTIGSCLAGCGGAAD